MKHFVEARTDALEALKAAKATTGCEKACLIVDLAGSCRALVSVAVGADPDAVERDVSTKLAPAADVFWGSDVWVESPGASASERALFEAVWREAVPEPQGQSELFVLDRRLSKDTWMGMPFDSPWPLNEHTPPILSFYSFKGGVGRTTLVLATAVNLARAGHQVVLVDFDLEAPGAGGLALGTGGIRASYGVLDYLLERPVAGRGALSIREYCHFCDDAAIIRNGVPIAVAPAGELDEWYLEKLARVNYDNLYRTAKEADAPRSPLHDLLRALRDQFNPSVVLIDSRAGLHDLGGLSLSGLAHLQVLVGLNSEQSWQGLTLALSHMGKQMVLAGRPQRDCVVVQAMVPAEPLRTEELRLFKERSFAAFGENYYDSPDVVGAQWPLPDMESVDAPHFPLSLAWDSRLLGYKSLVPPIADYLCEGDHRATVQAILARVGRELQ